MHANTGSITAHSVPLLVSLLLLDPVFPLSQFLLTFSSLGRDVYPVLDRGAPARSPPVARQGTFTEYPRKLVNGLTTSNAVMIGDRCVKSDKTSVIFLTVSGPELIF